MASMTRQQSTLLHEEQAGDYLPRRGSDQNLVCTTDAQRHQASTTLQCMVLLNRLT